MNKLGTIFYTLNGNIPSNKSSIYSKPITITSTTTLKFFAIDTASNKSPNYTQTYTINKKPAIKLKISSTTPHNQGKGFSRTNTINNQIQ